MCGISALFKFDGIKETDRERLAQMNKEMSYRGPDDSGVWNNATCGLAHTRLSIIGLDNGHQPIFNEDQKLSWFVMEKSTIINSWLHNFN